MDYACLYCEASGTQRTTDRHAIEDLENCSYCKGTTRISLSDLLLPLPGKIERLSRAVLWSETRMHQAQAKLDAATAEIERTIAEDSSLKNDQQRKAKRSELMQGEAYQTAQQRLQKAQEDYQSLKIDRQLAMNQFEAAKLMVQAHLAA
ncbi:hypothetical protein GFS31_08150 [Leptolyngbya sp. BL0902]|uniref:hypothetical protein n=1 Tax=Leptolyngbya sp. BL0902 TaxID=1115757 RepID=UPI0018E8018C|nr:hypothetical protein [Leptolyngbya sp. BL0902]QQE64136.1 hypothetical protein GFS31_08150 [Leptolyngbya sp. BL0902]